MNYTITLTRDEIRTVTNVLGRFAKRRPCELYEGPAKLFKSKMQEIRKAEAGWKDIVTGELANV